jgi:hypothetical protein
MSLPNAKWRLLLAKERKRITDGSGCMMGQTTRRNIQTVSF